MSEDSKVKVRIRYQFAPVPQELAQNPTITANTLAAITYLCSRGVDWNPRVYDIRKRFGWGDRVWRSVSKEMRDLKILGLKKTKKGTDLIFDPHGIEEIIQQKVIHNPPVQNSTLLKPTRAKRTYIDHIDHTSDRSYVNDHIDHKLRDDFKNKEEKNTRITMKERESQLSFEEGLAFQKLRAIGGIFPGVALSIVEQNSLAQINNVLEMAFRDKIKSAGKYIVKSLHRKGS